VLLLLLLLRQADDVADVGVGLQIRPARQRLMKKKRQRKKDSVRYGRTRRACQCQRRYRRPGPGSCGESAVDKYLVACDVVAHERAQRPQREVGQALHVHGAEEGDRRQLRGAGRRRRGVQVTGRGMQW
jgi:hypothetical protein